MPRFSDEADQDFNETLIQQRAGISGAGARLGAATRNGAQTRVSGVPIFVLQMRAIEEVTQRLYGAVHRVRDVADLISGPQPEKAETDRIDGPTGTIEVAWRQLVMVMNELDRQVSRLYNND